MRAVVVDLADLAGPVPKDGVHPRREALDAVDRDERLDRAAEAAAWMRTAPSPPSSDVATASATMAGCSVCAEVTAPPMFCRNMAELAPEAFSSARKRSISPAVRATARASTSASSWK